MRTQVLHAPSPSTWVPDLMAHHLKPPNTHLPLWQASGLGQAFIGMIILPIAGNACEHLAAVVMAAKNRMNLSLGIAIGSGLQISMFAIPFTVLVGWAIGCPFSLDVDLFALLALLFSVVHANLIIVSGSSNWLTGLTLIAIYVLVGATYFFR